MSAGPGPASAVRREPAGPNGQAPGDQRTAQLLGIKPAAPDGPVVETPPSRKAGALRYRYLREIVPDFWTPGLIDGVLERYGMTVVYGPSGCGKTAVIVDMAARIAAGMPWRGFPTMPGLVIYVASENATSTERRLWAWAQHHRRAHEELPLVLLESPVVLDGVEAVQALRVLVAQTQEECKAEAHFVVFDTLARTMKGDENSAEHMGVYVRMLDALKAETRAHVGVIHHTGKDETRGARGSSALKAATDHELELSKHTKSTGSVKLTKVREGELEGTRLGYELKSRTLGFNKLGRRVSTVLVEECDAPASEAKGRGVEDDGLIRGYLERAGRVTEKQMRADLPLRDNPESSKKAFQRAKARGIYSVDGNDWVVAP